MAKYHKINEQFIIKTHDTRLAIPPYKIKIRLASYFMIRVLILNFKLLYNRFIIRYII